MPYPRYYYEEKTEIEITDVFLNFSINELISYDIDKSINELLDVPEILTVIQKKIRERKLKRIVS